MNAVSSLFIPEGPLSSGIIQYKKKTPCCKTIHAIVLMIFFLFIYFNFFHDFCLGRELNDNDLLLPIIHSEYEKALVKETNIVYFMLITVSQWVIFPISECL